MLTPYSIFPHSLFPSFLNEIIKFYFLLIDELSKALKTKQHNFICEPFSAF